MLHLIALLNLVTALAIAQAVVKVLEIALDSRQKLAFQHATERLTLKLIDLDPIRHYQRLRNHKVQLKWFAAVILFVWGFGLFITLQDAEFDFRAWRQTSLDFWSVSYLLAIPIVLYLPFRLVLWWFGRSRNVWIMLTKAGTLGLIFLACMVAGDRYNIALLDTTTSGLILGLFFYSAAIVGILYIAQGAVWLFRHVMWRIATDTKGAWSAFLFVLAALLALAVTLVRKP
jgi:hypothetical protein